MVIIILQSHGSSNSVGEIGNKLTSTPTTSPDVSDNEENDDSIINADVRLKIIN